MLVNKWVEPKTQSGRTIIAYDVFTKKFEVHHNYYVELKALIIEHITLRNLKFKDFDHLIPQQNIEFFLDDNNEIAYRLSIEALKNEVQGLFFVFEKTLREFIKFMKYGPLSPKRYIINKYIKKIEKEMNEMDFSTIKLKEDYSIDFESFFIKYPDLYVKEVNKMYKENN